MKTPKNRQKKMGIKRLKNVPKWSQGDPRMVPKNGAKNEPNITNPKEKITTKRPQMGSKREQNDPEMMPK